MSVESIIEKKEERVVVGARLAMAVKATMEGQEEEGWNLVGWRRRMRRELEEILASTFNEEENGEVASFAEILGDFIVSQFLGLKPTDWEEKIKITAAGLSQLNEEEIRASLEFFGIRKEFAVTGMAEKTREKLEELMEAKWDLFPEDGILPLFLRHISERYPDPKSADYDGNR